MTLLDAVAQIGVLLRLALQVLEQVRLLLVRVAPLLPRGIGVAYENELLELVLEIQDRAGMRAVLERRQRVHVLAPETEAVRELVWGEGDQLARYSVRGARRMLVRPEGSRRAVLLGLLQRPRRGDQTTVSSRRVIKAGFLQATEYCETMVERPTRRVAITVIFPAGRPPREARMVSAPQERALRRVPVRFAADGRAYVRWSMLQPVPERVYSLRWSW